MSGTHPGKAVKSGWGAKILRLGGSRESPTRDVRAWRDGTQETLRPRWGPWVTQRDTQHMLTREHTDSSPGHTSTAHAEALAFRGRKATAQPNRSRSSEAPPRRAPTKACATGGGSGGRPARSASAPRVPASWREREERRGGGSGEEGCVPRCAGSGRPGRGERGAGPRPRRL